MVMIKNKLFVHCLLLSTTSSAILPILFTPPGCLPSIHISIYSPTARLDNDFVEAFATLYQLLSDLSVKYPNVPVFIRGDGNVNYKDKKRCQLLRKLCIDFEFESTDINHNTYHHFTGNGRSDSQLDVLLHTKGCSEFLIHIFCSKDDPTILSHYDLLIHTLDSSKSQLLQSVR